MESGNTVLFCSNIMTPLVLYPETLIVNSSRMLMPCTFRYEVDMTSGFASVQRQDKARIQLPGISVGDEVAVVVTGFLTPCMCGGIFMHFGDDDDYPNAFLLDDSGGNRGYAFLRHIFTPNEYATIGFIIKGAAHDMTATITSVLIFKINKHNTGTIMHNVRPNPVTTASPDAKTGYVNLIGQSVVTNKYPSLIINNGKRIIPFARQESK